MKKDQKKDESFRTLEAPFSGAARLHSIRTRMIFWTVGVTGLILAAVITRSYVNVRDRLESESIIKAAFFAEGSADKIDARLGSLTGLVRGIALAMESQSLNVPFERVKSLQFAALRDNPEIYGMCVALLDAAKPATWPDQAPYVFRGKGGPAYDTPAKSDSSYVGEDWFALPRYLDWASWTEPYLEAPINAAPVVKMVSYSIPIHIPGKDGPIFAGVVACDIDLGWLDQTIRNLPLGKNGYGFLMSRNGTYISHPLKNIVLNESVFSIAEARGDDSLRLTGRSMISGQPGLIPFISFATGEESWLAWQPLKTADWVMGTILSKAELKADILGLMRNEALVGFAGVILLAFAVWLVARSITRPVSALGKAAQTLASGNLDAILPLPRGKDEVAQLTAAFGSMRDNLKRHIAELAETTAARERMNGELRIAHDIQMDLVPKTFPAFPNRSDLDLFAIIEPAREVGGDFYDFFPLDDNKLVVSIGDVSGKGVPAALFMAVTRSFLRSEFRNEPDPGRVMAKVNDELSEGNESCMFVTLFCAVVDLSDGKVKYANAGHNPPIRVHSQGRIEWIAKPRGPAAGAMPGATYETGSFILPVSDALLLYTDGVTEAMDPAQVLYGEKRLSEKMKAFGALTCRECLGLLFTDIKDHAGGSEQSDDITMLMLKRLSVTSPDVAVPVLPGPDLRTPNARGSKSADLAKSDESAKSDEFADSGKKSLRLDIFNRMDSLSEALDRLDGFLEAENTGPKLAYAVRLVIEELVTNTIKYGYDDAEVHTVHISYRSGPAATMTIEDDGHPFDPCADAPLPDLEAPAEERPIGGLGLHMVRTMTASLAYRRVGNINRIEVAFRE